MRALWCFAWGKCFDASTLGFLCFFVQGSFRDIWCLDFWFSVDSDSCVCAHADVWSEKERNCWSLETETSASFHDTWILGVLRLMACVDEVFSISGIWIFEFFFVIVFNRRAPCFFAWGNCFDESTLGFFFCFGGLFAISGVWIFGFQSIQTLAYARISISGPKSTELSVTGDIRQFSWHLNFRSFGPDGLCRRSFFPYLVFGFLSFSLWLFLIGAPHAFSHGEIFLMNRPLGFCVCLFFFVFGGLFAISGVWIFGFQSIQTLAYARMLDFWSKKARNCRSLEISGSFHDTWILGVLGLMACADEVFFHIWCLDFWIFLCDCF